MQFNRREFIKSIMGAGMGAGLLACDGIRKKSESRVLETIPASTGTPSNDDTHIFFVKEAMFYEKMKEKEVLVGHSAAHTRHTAHSTHAAWRHRRHFSAALHRDEVVDFQYHVCGFGG